MAYTTLAAVKTHLGITDGSEDAQLSQWITQVGGVIDTHCNYALQSATRTEYYRGSGTRNLLLNHRNVSGVTDVWLDPTGYFGELGTAFGSATKLTVGVDYALLRDDAYATEVSAVGVIVRLNGVWPSVNARDRTMLTSQTVPGRGNIKVQYTAGFTTTPPDLELAAIMLVAEMRRVAPLGAPVSSFSLDYFSASFGDSQNNIVAAKSILGKYARWVA